MQRAEVLLRSKANAECLLFPTCCLTRWSWSRRISTKKICPMGIAVWVHSTKFTSWFVERVSPFHTQLLWDKLRRQYSYIGFGRLSKKYIFGKGSLSSFYSSAPKAVWARTFFFKFKNGAWAALFGTQLLKRYFWFLLRGIVQLGSLASDDRKNLSTHLSKAKENAWNTNNYGPLRSLFPTCSFFVVE